MSLEAMIALLRPPARRSGPLARLIRVSVAVSALVWPLAAGAQPPSLAQPASQPPEVVSDWVEHNTNIPLASVVSVGDEYIVALLSSRRIDPANPRVLRLEMRAELTDPDSQSANILRSLSATVDVNCDNHAARFVQVRTFTGPNLTGVATTNNTADGWAADPRGSYLEDIEAAVCNPSARRPLQDAKAAAGRAKSPQALSLRPALSADAPSPRRAIASHPGSAAQIAAALSQAKAEQALAALRSDLPAQMNGLSVRVERIDRGGKAYYRALVFGFAPPADAASFCHELAASGRACITR